MSRSRKKAFLTITPKIDKTSAHKRLRHKVKMELKKPEPDINVIESDTRELGMEDMGTVFGLEYDDMFDDDLVKKSRRK